MSKKIDDILYKSLRPEEEPATELNRRILQEWSKEEQEMTRFNYKKKIAAVAMVCVLAGGGMTTYAAYHLLNPAQVVQTATQNDKLMKAFESKDAILVNETQSCNGYDISLLGLVSGNDLQLFVPENTKESIEGSHTYAAVAIAKSDGSAMEDRNFCISPMINGVSFMDANIATLSGMATWFLQDGVVYQLIECDNLEMFADRGVQLGVVDNFGDETSAFTMDEKTGVYNRAKDCNGTNALFTLPLDASKADPEKAKEYLESSKASQDADVDVNETAEGTEVTIGEDGDASYETAQKFISTMTPDNISQYFELVPESSVTVKPDENGNLNFGSVQIDGDTCDFGEVSADAVLKLGKNFGADLFLADETSNGSIDWSNMTIYTITKNEDGSYTQAMYKSKVNVMDAILK